MSGFESFSQEQNNNEQHAHAEQLQLMKSLEAVLGFEHTPKMIELEQRIIAEPMNVEGLFTDWHIEAEQIVEAMQEDSAFLNAQIGLAIAQAAIYLELNKLDECYETLGSATEVAAYMKLDHIIERILEIGNR